MLKVYLRNLYRVLTALTVVTAIIFFFTGKATFADYLSTFSSYSAVDQSVLETKIRSSDSASTFEPNSDNLITTLAKTIFVAIAFFFLCLATLFSFFLELFIVLFSWGDHPFYCSKQVWNLCWNKIVLNWYWIPGKSLYLGISLILVSGIFGNESRDAPRDLPKIVRRSRTRGK